MQTFRDFEWIIQDCVSDEDYAFIREDQRLPTAFVSEFDHGIYDALNRALRRSSGDWILVLGAGDWLAGPTALERLAGLMSQESDVAICDVFEVFINGNITRRVADHPSSKVSLLKDFTNHRRYKHFLEGMPCHQGVLVKRSRMEEHPFDLNFKISADWHQLLRLSFQGCNIQRIDHSLAWYPNGGFSYQNSCLWVEEICSIISHFSGRPDLAREYMLPVLAEHRRLEARRHELRRIISHGFS